MKFRNGFVTNSSSSSFVIAIKDNASTTIDAFVDAFVGTEDYEDTRKGHCIRTKEELDNYYLENYKTKSCPTLDEILADDSYLNGKYNTALSHIQNGYIILGKSIGYDAQALCSFLSIFVKSMGADAIILEDE